jgi:hypothetical protein
MIIMKDMCYQARILALSGILLIVSGCNKDPIRERDEFVRDVAEAVSADSLKSYVQWLEEMGTRFSLADNHRQVASEIRDRFITFGYPDTKLDSFYLTSSYKGVEYNTWQFNVIATLSGSYTDSLSIVGAHYDNAISAGDPFELIPGANDNASGVAAALEIARLVKKSGFNPRYTIKFVAFGAEEAGLHGSRDFAGKASVNGDKIMMMINHDMIAYLAPATVRPWYVNIIYYDNSAGLREDAERLCASNTNLISFSDNTSYNRSDSYSFFMFGYKSLFLQQSGPDDTYHTISDLASACNFDYCREIVKISCSLLLERNYQ